MTTRSVDSPGDFTSRSAMVVETHVPSRLHATPSHGEEELIVDDRSELRPAQMVEDKLAGMLKGEFVMVSQLRLKALIAHRS